MLGTLVGIVIAAQSIEAAGAISTTLVWGGIKVAMLPVRFVSAFAGRGVLYLVRLPVQVFRFLVQLVGLVLVVAIVVLVVVTLLTLLAAA